MVHGIRLPKLAECIHKLKGDIFGFGEYSNTLARTLSQTNPVKLGNARIHYLYSERNMGLINYELSRRGVILCFIDSCKSNICSFISSIKSYKTRKQNTWNKHQKLMQDDLQKKKMQIKQWISEIIITDTYGVVGGGGGGVGGLFTSSE